MADDTSQKHTAFNHHIPAEARAPRNAQEFGGAVATRLCGAPSDSSARSVTRRSESGGRSPGAHGI